MSGIRPAAHGPKESGADPGDGAGTPAGAVPEKAVLTAPTPYTAAAAQGAAAALIRMFVEQGVFGLPLPPPDEEASGPAAREKTGGTEQF